MEGLATPHQVERFDLLADEGVHPVELLLELRFGAEVPRHRFAIPLDGPGAVVDDAARRPPQLWPEPYWAWGMGPAEAAGAGAPPGPGAVAVGTLEVGHARGGDPGVGGGVGRRHAEGAVLRLVGLEPGHQSGDPGVGPGVGPAHLLV